jgi:hypothetical protein
MTARLTKHIVLMLMYIIENNTDSDSPTIMQVDVAMRLMEN